MTLHDQPEFLEHRPPTRPYAGSIRARFLNLALW
eukprot:CAMPEP_0185750558 /NCGR_PEP_ID=MMETSP1174-20130828/9340_1 /TAXON_ID=35687 /ORGANISM="Dictyocha speculum, Strain CCMP1381" /LENGTH=33 /DNA_ID= /DNA_START= /DNA_END= /DNA_ORIENTATION=